MQRRHVLAFAAAGLLPPLAARAHHGWGGFDQDRPIYLEGKAESVVWKNPHAELTLRLTPGLVLPADLAKRAVPAQSASVDAARILSVARLPTRKDPVWELELAPLTRMPAPNWPGCTLPAVMPWGARKPRGEPFEAVPGDL